MSDSHKSEKRGKYRNPRRIRCADVENQEQSWAIYDRHQQGSTEKILRRNRKLWTRLLGKRRRANGKAVIAKQLAD